MTLGEPLGMPGIREHTHSYDTSMPVDADKLWRCAGMPGLGLVLTSDKGMITPAQRIFYRNTISYNLY